MFSLNLFKRHGSFEQKKSLLAADIRKEMGRRKSQANNILADLIVHGERYTHQLEQHAFNYTARVSDLRKRGYVIECEYKEPGVYVYKYYGLKKGGKG